MRQHQASRVMRSRQRRRVGFLPRSSVPRCRCREIRVSQSAQLTRCMGPRRLIDNRVFTLALVAELVFDGARRTMENFANIIIRHAAMTEELGARLVISGPRITTAAAPIPERRMLLFSHWSCPA